MHENRNLVVPVNIATHSVCAPRFLRPHMRHTTAHVLMYHKTSHYLQYMYQKNMLQLYQCLKLI